MLVTITEVVDVYDPPALIAYAKSKAKSWGMDESQMDDVATAVRESIVLNRCVPYDIGIELGHEGSSAVVSAATIRTPGTVPTTNVEEMIEAANRHGEGSDPDHEVGDLQELLRAAFELLTDDAKKAFFASPAAKNVWDSAYGE